MLATILLFIPVQNVLNYKLRVATCREDFSCSCTVLEMKALICLDFSLCLIVEIIHPG